MRARVHIKSHPLHPILVAFPIGLWIASLVFDLIGLAAGNNLLWAAGFYCIIGGCIMAALAAVPGVIDLFTVVPPNSSGRTRGYIHGSLNSLALLLFISIAALRGNALTSPGGLPVLLSVIGVAGIFVSGWLGGTLVYRNQIGVDHRYAGSGKFRERTLKSFNDPVINKAELADGQMLLAAVEGQRIVVGRCGEGVFAFADHCTHKGGPLSDGESVWGGPRRLEQRGDAGASNQTISAKKLVALGGRCRVARRGDGTPGARRRPRAHSTRARRSSATRRTSRACAASWSGSGTRRQRRSRRRRS